MLKNVVPIISVGRGNEVDTRFNGHKGTQYVSGGVLYEEVNTSSLVLDSNTNTYVCVPGTVINKFITFKNHPVSVTFNKDIIDYNIGVIKKKNKIKLYFLN